MADERAPSPWALAAAGDAAAQASLVQRILDGSFEGTTPLDEAIVAAEAIACVAAQSGRPSDIATFGAIMLLRAKQLERRGEAERARTYWAESENAFGILAEAGHQTAQAYFEAEDHGPAEDTITAVTIH